MNCPICLAELRREGTLAEHYGYCPSCLKYVKLKDAVKPGDALTIVQRLARLEAEVHELKAKLEGKE